MIYRVVIKSIHGPSVFRAFESWLTFTFKTIIQINALQIILTWTCQAFVYVLFQLINLIISFLNFSLKKENINTYIIARLICTLRSDLKGTL